MNYTVEGQKIYILHGNPENPQRAEQVLVETENEILGYDGIFGITETEWEVQKEREVSATKQEALEQQSAEKIDGDTSSAWRKRKVCHLSDG